MSKWLIALACAASLAACSSMHRDQPADESAASSGSGTVSNSASGVSQNNGVNAKPYGDVSSVPTPGEQTSKISPSTAPAPSSGSSAPNSGYDTSNSNGSSYPSSSNMGQ